MAFSFYVNISIILNNINLNLIRAFMLECILFSSSNLHVSEVKNTREEFTVQVCKLHLNK